jgi:hypothetical protein
LNSLAKPKRTKRDAQILDLAERILPLVDGQLELDRHSAVVSEGFDNGAYVQVWAWVPFAGTELDKEAAYASSPRSLDQ